MTQTQHINDDTGKFEVPILDPAGETETITVFVEPGQVPADVAQNAVEDMDGDITIPVSELDTALLHPLSSDTDTTAVEPSCVAETLALWADHADSTTLDLSDPSAVASLLQCTAEMRELNEMFNTEVCD